MKTLNSIFLILMLCAAGMCFGMEPESLIEAVKKNDVKQVQDLLQKGADVNQVGDFGVMPLHLAAQDGNVELCKLFIARGADVNQADNGGWTPLCFAVYNRHVEVSKLLLKHGAKVNESDCCNNSILYFAACRENVEITVLLLAHGSDVVDAQFNKEQKDIATLQKAVEGIIDGTFKQEIDVSTLALLCMAREDDEKSLLYQDSFSYDDFLYVIQPVPLSLSPKQVEDLIIFFKNCHYLDNHPFMQKLKEYKNSIK
ncbi:MAG: ankyrin repeat domain-containing protein [Candidatus Babeliales bacterium]